MIRRGLLMAAASILAATPALAEVPLAPLVATEAKPAARFGWAGLGVYDVRLSTIGGTFTDAYVGLNAGAAMTVAPLTPEVSLLGFGNVAMAFASGGQFFPLTAGVAARFEQLPVQVLGGIGGTVMLNTTSNDTGLGVAFLVMGLYPLTMIDPRLSAQAQIQYHLLTNNLSLFTINVGAGFSL